MRSREVALFKRTIQLITLCCLAFLAASQAEAGVSSAHTCAAGAYSYAGLGSASSAHGIAATLVPISAPSVSDGEVAGWVGVAGTGGWIQVGLSAVSGPDSHMNELYYEVVPPGAPARYVELDSSVRPGEARRVSVLELSGRKAWWRVWVDQRPVSPPIYLRGSHEAWYPEAVGENMAGVAGICNRYAYRFTDVKLAHKAGGDWRPLQGNSVYEDAGYRFVQTSSTPRSFVATSVAVRIGSLSR